MNRSIHFGINAYPSIPLHGCVNDATMFSEFFAARKFDRVLLFKDRDVKRARVTQVIGDALTESVAGDKVRITYSGHGTHVPDKSGDEADGYDEALYLYDGVWIDDEIAHALEALPEGVDLGIILDSCHSGTSTRGIPENARARSPRCVVYPGAHDLPANCKMRRMFSNVRKARADVKMNHVLLAGAMPNEYSWDCQFNGQPWGAMSYWALHELNRRPTLTWEDLHKAIRTHLPSADAPQHPQLEGPSSMKRSMVA